MGWTTHVGHVTSKASRMLGLVMRNLRAYPEKLEETAYNSLVRLQTEYADAAWDPSKNKKDYVGSYILVVEYTDKPVLQCASGTS